MIKDVVILFGAGLGRSVNMGHSVVKCTSVQHILAERKTELALLPFVVQIYTLQSDTIVHNNE